MSSRMREMLGYMSVEEVENALRRLDVEEAELNEQIERLVVKSADIQHAESELVRIQESLVLLESDAGHLQQTLEFSGRLAENVSGKIRHLDAAKQRVEETLQRIEDVLDLRFCTEGVQVAMQNEEYEIAAGHIHRFLKMDENLLMRSAEEMRQQNNLQQSLALLHQAHHQLKSIINAKFDEALNVADSANVERLFKIFPLMNLHQHGLNKFCTYLSSDISDKAQKLMEDLAARLNDPNTKKSASVFVELMTRLVETVAGVVETYQPLVETYYGAGYLLHFVRNIQAECDRQSVRLIEEFLRQRRFAERAKEIRLLVRKTIKSTGGGLHSVIDPLELDALLLEVTVMNARVELYLNFMRKKLLADYVAVDQSSKNREAHAREVETLLSSSQLSRRMQELMGDYVSLEEYYMRQSMRKAVAMEQMEEASLTSSMVDEVFFVVRKSIRRALSSCSVHAICATLNHAVSLLQEDLADVLLAKLKNNVYVAYTIDLSQAYYTMIGTSTPVDNSVTDKNRRAFLAHLCDADVSIGNIKRLVETLQSELTVALGNVSQHELQKIQTTLQDLFAATHSFQVVLDTGISLLHTAILKPRIKPLVDGFISVSHNISDDDFQSYEISDPFVENFICNIQTLLGLFKPSLTSNVLELLVKYVGAEIADQLEKAIVKLKYSRLGGIQLDKEIRVLIHYLSSLTSWSIRDKFSRITQIVTILNVDSLAEFQELWNPSSNISLAWRITPSEARQVLLLRTDFRPDEIKKLKL